MSAFVLRTPEASQELDDERRIARALRDAVFETPGWANKLSAGDRAAVNRDRAKRGKPPVNLT